MEEKIASLFQPDILLPAQYLETLRRKSDLEPERKLMLAVLQDAIACFQDYASAQGGKKKKLFGEAEEWILAEDNSWPFSFQNICESIGFDPKHIRQRFLRPKQRKPAGLLKANVYHLTSRRKRTPLP